MNFFSLSLFFFFFFLIFFIFYELTLRIEELSVLYTCDIINLQYECLSRNADSETQQFITITVILLFLTTVNISGTIITYYYCLCFLIGCICWAKCVSVWVGMWIFVYIVLLFVCKLLYIKGVQHLSGSFAFSCTSSIYVLYYFGVFYIDGK